MENTSSANNFKYKHSILLYLVYEGYQQHKFTDTEKTKIKTQIITQICSIIFITLKNHNRPT